MALLRSDVLSHEFILEAVRHYEKTTNVEVLSITIGDVIEGIQEIIPVQVTAMIRRTEKEYNWTAKIASRSEQIGETGRSLSLWEREKRVYRELLPHYEQTGERSGIIIPTQAQIIYYKFIQNKECILFSDMSAMGFEPPGAASLDTEAVYQTVDWLAKFHALGYNYQKSGHDIEWLYDPVPLAGTKNSELIKTIRELQAPNSSVLLEYATRLESLFSTPAYAQICRETLGPRKQGFSTICHGRPSQGNVRVWEVDGRAMETILINFEEARYCQPGTDLAILLYTSTTKQFRKEELGNVLKRYHTALLDTLLDLGFPPDVYTFSQLFEDYQDAVVPAVGIAVNTLPGLLGSEDETDANSSGAEQSLLEELLVEMAETGKI